MSSVVVNPCGTRNYTDHPVFSGRNFITVLDFFIWMVFANVVPQQFTAVF